MIKLTLFLTELCNKRCSYCDIAKLQNRKTVSLETLYEYIPIIMDNFHGDTIKLTGGECGLLPTNIMDYLITTLGSRYNLEINTNGKLFNNYNEYLDEFSVIYYHPVEEINKPFKKIYRDNVYYQFPIHANNLEYLPTFFNDTCDLKLSLLLYDLKHIDNTEYLLTEENLTYVYELIKDKDYDVELEEQLRLILKDGLSTDSIRNVCFNKVNIFPSIDLVNKKIDKCICSHTYTNKLELTEKNIRKLFKDNLTFENQSEVCDNCYLCMRNYKEIINQSIKRMKNETT